VHLQRVFYVDLLDEGQFIQNYGFVDRAISPLKRGSIQDNQDNQVTAVSCAKTSTIVFRNKDRPHVPLGQKTTTVTQTRPRYAQSLQSAPSHG